MDDMTLMIINIFFTIVIIGGSTLGIWNLRKQKQLKNKRISKRGIVDNNGAIIAEQKNKDGTNKILEDYVFELSPTLKLGDVVEIIYDGLDNVVEIIDLHKNKAIEKELICKVLRTGYRKDGGFSSKYVLSIIDNESKETTNERVEVCYFPTTLLIGDNVKIKHISIKEIDFETYEFVSLI